MQRRTETTTLTTLAIIMLIQGEMSVWVTPKKGPFTAVVACKDGRYVQFNDLRPGETVNLEGACRNQ
jgi:hypothetical protein